MPGTVDEPKWNKAKKKVKEQGKDPEKNYPLVNHIYQNMGGKFHKKKESSTSDKLKKLARDLKKPSRYADAEEVTSPNGNGTSPVSHLQNYNDRKVQFRYSVPGASIEGYGVLSYSNSGIAIYSKDDSMVLMFSAEDLGNELHWTEETQNYTSQGPGKLSLTLT